MVSPHKASSLVVIEPDVCWVGLLVAPEVVVGAGICPVVGMVPDVGSEMPSLTPKVFSPHAHKHSTEDRQDAAYEAKFVINKGPFAS